MDLCAHLRFDAQWRSRIAIDGAAMPDLDHLDDDSRVVDRIHNAIHALPDSIEFTACQFLAARRPRIVAQYLDPLQQTTDFGLWNSTQVLGWLVVLRPRHRRLDPLEAYATLWLRFARALLGDKLLDGIKDSGELFVIPFLECFNLTSEGAVRIHQSP